ncbi:MAG: hypothetical protein HY910_00350 [Desulfarculus sp.]|nr:hypothetical protein [Desulfarculus sp.]
MRSIQVDDEVYAKLINNIREFGESPNQVLRRLLGLTAYYVENGQVSEGERDSPTKIGSVNTRAMRTKLSLLTASGYLREGQKLYLYSQDLRNELCVAYVDGDYLVKNNKKYSMSSLALKMFKANGHNVKAVRGPAYWFVGEEDDDPSIADLWAKYLEVTAG